ncbi:hypothetical protein [Ruegeria marina]|uniref:Uncharacterized protein n=1 Tax=Ruegeria marina TaxID=639004 RepID=A0A1G7EW19_9RHOB|nr:hypothetical protein [Ruegeria marina]SDE67656.1 hypothetical protein SAMN04488239_12725 [Ruegeria marina]
METKLEADIRMQTFIKVRTVRVPEGEEPTLADGNCCAFAAFEEGSRATRFAQGEGLPGKAVATGHPVVESWAPGGVTAGSETMVALPIHHDRDIAHIVAWNC